MNESTVDRVLLWMASGLSGADLETACVAKLDAAKGNDHPPQHPPRSRPRPSLAHRARRSTSGEEQLPPRGVRGGASGAAAPPAPS